VNFQDPGQYFITLYAYGCGYDSVRLPVTVYPLPDIALIHDQQKCPGEPVNFWVNSVAPAIQLWFGDGDSTWQRNISHIFPGPGTYIPFARATTQRGCQSSVSGSLLIHELPSAQAVASDSVCTSAPATFQGASNMPGVSCSWRFGDGIALDGCAHTRAYANQGNYTAIFRVVSPEGCPASDTVEVVVRTIPEALFDFSFPQACAPATASFLSQATGATAIRWKLSDGYTSDDYTFSRTFTQAGNYAAVFITSNDGICPDTAQVSFEVFPIPDLDVATDVGCIAGEGTNLTATTGVSNQLLVTGPGYSSSGTVHNALSPGIYTVLAETEKGCMEDTTVTILPVNELILRVEQDYFDLVLGEYAPLSAKVNKTDVEFVWEPVTWLSDPLIADPVSRPVQSVIYTVTGTDGNGCTKTDTVRIEVSIDYDASLFIPNAFTPNNDGVNDVFYARSNFPEALRIDYFRIFDKYNETVFDLSGLDGHENATPEDRLFGWDGDFRGEKAEAGSYRFTISVIFPDGINRTYAGTVQLIR
jgi:gliding motility-associated-like protein